MCFYSPVKDKNDSLCTCVNRVNSIYAYYELWSTDIVYFSLQLKVDLVQHFIHLPADHLGPESTWVPSQPSARRCSYPTMRRCWPLCKWRGGRKRRYPSWQLVVKETTWPLSASQVSGLMKLFSSLTSSLIFSPRLTLMSMLAFKLPITWKANWIYCWAVGQSFLNTLGFCLKLSSFSPDNEGLNKFVFPMLKPSKDIAC